MKKIIRTATIPLSLKIFLNGSIELLKIKYNLVLVSSPEKELQELHEQYGVTTIGIPMERHISLTKDIASLWRLVKIFRKEKPFMVHSMTPKAGLLCMMAAWLTHVPRRVHTFTGLVWPTATGLSRKILMFTDWLTCVCATHVIPEGKGVMNDLQQHITKKPLKVLGYGNVRGIDTTYWNRTTEVMQKSNILRKKNRFTFIFVGRLVRDKGINELVEAFCKLYIKNQDVRLLLIGPTEDNLDPLQSVTWERINTTPSIEAIGPVWNDKILLYYAASDCFVLPSYREGFPNTVLEAGAMGLPSIVTDINGSREIIQDGKNGIIIPSKDTDALYKAMDQMSTNKEACSRMASNARSMIQDRFEQSFVCQCLLDFYDEIM